MSKTKMPAAEVSSDVDTQEVVSYELAYHVLPTVAEGEVSSVRDSIAARITEAGGTIGIEEMPQRFDLAYEITKYIEGKYRHFNSAYFGWIRFTLTPEAVTALGEAVASEKSLLRHLVIRLSKIEEASPFYFHEALEANKKVTNVGDVEEDIDPNAETKDTEVDTEDVDETTAKAAGTDTVETEVEAVDTDVDEGDDNESKA